MARNEPVAVIGLGRFGRALALELARGGTEVLGVDVDPRVVQGLAGQLEQVVVADASDVEALREIGIAGFTRAVVAIGTNLQASIITTSLLSDLEVDDIWAKALDDQQARILRRVGAHHVVLPEHDMGERVAHLVSGRALDYLEVDEGWVLAKTRPPHHLVGVPLGRSGLRAKRRVTVVSVKPAQEQRYRHTDTTTVLAYGDEILVAGAPADVDRFIDEM
ncbi:potassium channel family protein [Kineococcus auxinigenes]|uniref:potassium channel family protein n=1 Tax=unclassified Kineococcus TaxID=2621656 RepID=UPI003D7E18BC